MKVFNEEETRSYLEDGFVIKSDFFNFDEVTLIKKETERLYSEGIFRNIATDEYGNKSKSKKNFQLIPLYDQSKIFRSLPYQQKVIQAISELIGDPFVLRLDQIFLKPARNGLGTNWHQDNAYFKISDPMKGIALWIAIHDANASNGTIEIIPGLHHQTLEHERDSSSDHHIRCYPHDEKSLTVELNAGGVIFFCYGIPHKTGPNRSEHPRAGLAYHFIHEDFISEKVHQFPNYCRYMTGEKASGGMNEYGTLVEHEFM